MKLKIIETKKFQKLKKALFKYSSISVEDLEYIKKTFATELFKNPSIRPHKIKCGKDFLISLTIPNTQYRILCYLVCEPKVAIFGWIGTHREYEKIIKSKKNCKDYIFDCDEIIDLF